MENYIQELNRLYYSYVKLNNVSKFERTIKVKNNDYLSMSCPMASAGKLDSSSKN